MGRKILLLSQTDFYFENCIHLSVSTEMFIIVKKLENIKGGNSRRESRQVRKKGKEITIEK